MQFFKKKENGIQSELNVNEDKQKIIYIPPKNGKITVAVYELNKLAQVESCEKWEYRANQKEEAWERYNSIIF